MANFSDMIQPKGVESEEVKYGDNVIIKVFQQISARSMYDIVMITLENSKESNGIYNDFLLDMYFNLNLIYAYTDITFSNAEREDEMSLYTQLEESGILKLVLEHIPAKDYNAMYDYIKTFAENDMKYSGKIGAAIENFVTELPVAMEKVAKIAENFDMSQFQNVVDFARAANGDRPIPLSEPIE